MSNPLENPQPEQAAVPDSAFPPTEIFAKVQSIPARFEKIVRMYPNRLALKAGDHALTYEELGVNDNFFDLGGHSLAATRVVSQVIKQFQLELPLLSLFQSPTVAEMAAVIAEHQGNLLGKEELERLLSELELMSDEEAQQLVAKETVKG